jgi:hypothetical protein
MQIFTVTPNKQKAPLQILLLLHSIDAFFTLQQKTVYCKNTKALSQNLTLTPKLYLHYYYLLRGRFNK